MTTTLSSFTESTPLVCQIDYTLFDANNVRFPQQPVEKNIPNSEQKYMSDEIVYCYATRHGKEEHGPLSVRFPRTTWRIFKNVDSTNAEKVSYSAVANVDEHDPHQKQVKAVLDGIQQMAAARLAQHPLYNDLFGPEDDTNDKRWNFAMRDSTLKHLARQQRDKAKKIIPGRKPSIWVKLRPGSTVLVSINGQPMNDWEKLVNSTVEIEAPLICFSSIFKGSGRSIQCHMVSGLVLRKIEKVNIDTEKLLALEFREKNPELYEKYQASFSDPFASGASSSEGASGSGTASGASGTASGASGSTSSPTKTTLVTPPPIPGTSMPTAAVSMPAYGNAADFSAGLTTANLPTRQ